MIFLHVPKTGGKTVRTLFDIRRYYDPKPHVIPSPQHLTCDLLRDRLGDEKYESYYKFAFVRNPWSRLVSDYFWRQQLPKKRNVPPFDEFVDHVQRVVASGRFYEHEFDDHFIPQVQYTSDVDDVFRFEDFSGSIQKLASKLGLKIGPVAEKQPKPYDKYWQYYDKRSRSVVAETYKEDIEAFGYEFEEE